MGWGREDGGRDLESVTPCETVGSPARDRRWRKEGHFKMKFLLLWFLSRREKELMKIVCFKVSRRKNAYLC